MGDSISWKLIIRSPLDIPPNKLSKLPNFSARERQFLEYGFTPGVWFERTLWKGHPEWKERFGVERTLFFKPHELDLRIGRYESGFVGSTVKYIDEPPKNGWCLHGDFNVNLRQRVRQW